jgi:hypothetical protein
MKPPYMTLQGGFGERDCLTKTNSTHDYFKGNNNIQHSKIFFLSSKNKIITRTLSYQTILHQYTTLYY